MRSYLPACLVLMFATAELVAGNTTTTDMRSLLLRRAGRSEDLASAWIRCGDAHMQQSRDRLDPRYYSAAERAYRSALEADPSRTQAMLGLAWVKNSEHNFPEGRHWAETALALDSNLPDAHALIADGEVELGNYTAALEQCQKALDLRPDLASYSRAAHLLWLTGDATRACELMTTAIRAGGPALEHTAWCAAQLALMFAHAGDLESARRTTQEGLRGSPENVHLLAADGRIRAMLGDDPGAIAALKHSVRIAPTHEALAALAELHIRAHDTAAFDAAFAAVLALQARHAHRHTPADGAHTHLPPDGSAQLALFLADHDRDLDAALREAQSAYAAFPNAFAADALAWCLYKHGRTTEAAAMIRLALRWETPLADLHFHAGMILRASGELTDARTHLARALRLNPSFHPRFAGIAESTLGVLQRSDVHVSANTTP